VSPYNRAPHPHMDSADSAARAWKPLPVALGALGALGALALATAGCGGSKSPWVPGTPRHVILISLDTLRADRCGMYGYGKPTTPFLDSLAREGVLFEHHLSNSNNTLISHASILTGLVPEAHDTYDSSGGRPRHRLASSAETLAERFREAGFATAAFTTHPAWLGHTFGLDQGFDELESSWCDAQANTREFLRWVDAESPERMFAFLHFYDAHSEASGRGGTLPYDSSPELVAQFAGPTPEGFTGCLKEKPYMCCSRFLRAVDAGEEPLSDEHLRFISDLYDAGLRKLDDDLAHLFGELRRRGLLEHTLIVITSDHGEEFREHGHLLHGGYGEEIVQVPLLVCLPFDMPHAAARIAGTTRSIDLAPTLLDFARLKPIGQGRSLRAAILRNEPLEDADLLFNNDILRARDAESLFKFGADANPEFFYDLTHDPGERTNLLLDPEFVARSKERLDAIRKRFERLEAQAKDIAAGLRAAGENAVPLLNEHDASELNKLGYTDR
jgi:arylsulfatase A-like enzyme